MKRHVIIAAFVLALAAYLPGEVINPALQESQSQIQTSRSNTKLSKKDRKRLEKEEKKAREQERKEEKHEHENQTKEERKKYKEQEKEVAKQRKRELKEEQKQVASARKKEGKHERKEVQREEKAEARDMNRHIAREERASVAAVPRVSRIPISTTAPPRLLLAQRDVSRAIYSQLPGSNVRVLLNGGNQIVLSGSAPSPSWRQRLLQLAVGAAQGYSVVDQLAANLVGDAAGAATSAAIGGVSDLIHGSGGRNSEPESGSAPPPESAMQAPPDSQPALPNNDSQAGSSVLDSGSNACVNVSSSSQVMLTGQLTSQTSADLVRRFAHQVAGPSAVVSDQLAVRTSGVPSTGNAPQDVASSSDALVNTSANSPAVSPGSTVCVTENSGQTFLTGTVGSTAELGAVENAVQPLVGSGRLLDHLTIAGVNSANPIASSAPVDNNASPPTQQNELEQALHSLPRLANVNVQVGSDGVHLSGSVDSTQDDQTASDIVRQYAPGRPVLDNMAVANRTQPFPH